MASEFQDWKQVEASRSSARLALPHAVESEVHRRIQQQPNLTIKSLVVHRTPNGVCLEGRIESPDPQIDLAGLMQGIPGLEEIVNHLVITTDSEQTNPV